MHRAQFVSRSETTHEPLPRVAATKAVVDTSAPKTFLHLYFNRKRFLVRL
jgi:hypothetical protein